MNLKPAAEQLNRFRLKHKQPLHDFIKIKFSLETITFGSSELRKTVLNIISQNSPAPSRQHHSVGNVI